MDEQTQKPEDFKKKPGRPPGSKNKLGMQLRETITAFCENNFQQVQDDFQALPAKERVKLYCELLPYVVPRLQAATMDVSIERLSEDQIDTIIERLMDQE